MLLDSVPTNVDIPNQNTDILQNLIVCNEIRKKTSQQCQLAKFLLYATKEIMQPVLADEGRHSNTVQKLDVL